MSSVHIFVEGVTDQKFIQDVIAEWYEIILPISTPGKQGNITAVDGKNAFDSLEKRKKLTPIFQQLAIQEIPAIVIFDADHFTTNQERLSPHSQAFQFSYFLFPDNQRDGEIETLLEEIICPDNQPVFDCWTNFEHCLSQHETPSTDSGKFTTPASKTKIYAYVETLVGTTDSEKEKIKDRKRDYRNKRHWNLDPEHPSLKPLKEFLDPFFRAQ